MSSQSQRVSAGADKPRRQSRTKARATERLQSADRRLADALPLREVNEIVAATEGAVEAVDDGTTAGVSSVTGRALPSPRELARARRVNLLRAFTERRALLADALTVPEVAELLGVGRQTPHDRAKAGTLLAVKENGRLVFPEWQFDPEGPDGVLSGLPDVLGVLADRPISALGRVRWFVSPKSLMNGRTPLEALRTGAIDEVVHEAQSIGAS